VPPGTRSRRAAGGSFVKAGHFRKGENVNASDSVQLAKLVDLQRETVTLLKSIDESVKASMMLHCMALAANNNLALQGGFFPRRKDIQTVADIVQQVVSRGKLSDAAKNMIVSLATPSKAAREKEHMPQYTR
jgi:hypothetical protein